MEAWATEEHCVLTAMHRLYPNDSWRRARQADKIRGSLVQHRETTRERVTAGGIITLYDAVSDYCGRISEKVLPVFGLLPERLESFADSPSTSGGVCTSKHLANTLFKLGILDADVSGLSLVTLAESQPAVLENFAIQATDLNRS